MRLSDIQPQYFPRIHYFARMLESDEFVLRDDVQFVRNHQYPGGERGVSFQAHTPIKGPEGRLLLGVSVRKGSGQAINRTAVCYQQKWRSKHINMIKQHYRAAPNFKALMPGLEALLQHQYPTLADLNIATICWSLGHLLGFTPGEPGELGVEQANRWLAQTGRERRLQRISLGSERLASSESSDASQRIVELCQAVGATEYLAGGTAVDAYLDRQPFEDGRVEIAVQDWQCPPYPQLHAKRGGHVANLSILDLLFNSEEPGQALPLD